MPRIAGPAGRAVLRGRGGAPAPAHRGDGGLRLRGLGLRGDHPSALRLRGRVRRSRARTQDLLVRGPGRHGARPASRLHEPPRQDRGGPARATGRPPSASTTRARSSATSRPRRGGRASSSRWAWSTSEATLRARTRRPLAIAAECLDRLGAEGWVLALGHVGVFGGLLAEAGLSRDVPGVAARPRGGEGPRGRPRPPGARARGRGDGVGGGAAHGPRGADRGAGGSRRASSASALPPAPRLQSSSRLAETLAVAGLGDRGSSSTWARSAASTTTRGSSSGPTRPASASRWAAAGATTRSSAASAARCPRWGSCSGSTAWRSSSRSRASCPPSPRRRSSSWRTRALGAALLRARAARDAGRRVRFGKRREAVSLTVALSKGKLLLGTEVLFRRAKPAFP